MLDYLENNLKVLYKKLEATIYPLFSEEILKAEIIILLENLEVGVRRGKLLAFIHGLQKPDRQ